MMGLDEGDEGHVTVGGDGDGSHEVGGELVGEEDGGGAVGATDDGDGGGFACGEAKKGDGDDEGEEDAELGGGAEEEGLGVGDEGAEVGQGADAEEDEGGEDFPEDAELDEVVEASDVGAVELADGGAFAHGGACVEGADDAAGGGGGKDAVFAGDGEGAVGAVGFFPGDGDGPALFPLLGGCGGVSIVGDGGGGGLPRLGLWFDHGGDDAGALRGEGGLGVGEAFSGEGVLAAGLGMACAAGLVGGEGGLGGVNAELRGLDFGGEGFAGFLDAVVFVLKKFSGFAGVVKSRQMLGDFDGHCRYLEGVAGLEGGGVDDAGAVDDDLPGRLLKEILRRKVGQQGAEGDRDEEQGLELPAHGQVEEDADDAPHEQHAGCDVGKSRKVYELSELVHVKWVVVS